MDEFFSQSIPNFPEFEGSFGNHELCFKNHQVVMPDVAKLYLLGFFPE
jgi:hypothetical protein